ncbi:hypothetical protein [Membranihabitans maritimus]|uniref:hypothetical protein n=1 Tax=Membranihabitans maritimus TaxID=2904244 RepID=UPI001F471C43|nr:hypothetical protein [Membranihabitans maritimus]
MELSDVIREITFPIGMILLLITQFYQYKTGKKASGKQQRNILMVLLMVFVIITLNIILILDDRIKEIIYGKIDTPFF